MSTGTRREPRTDSERRRHLLVLSPSAELYGSDRALLYALPEMKAAYDVTVAFATDGPLVEAARKIGVTAIVVPDFALRRRLLNPFAVVAWAMRARRAAARLGALHRVNHVDLVYSNTLAVFIGPILARVWRVPHLVHAHECPLEPHWLTALLLFCMRPCTVIVCNSEYTRRLIVGFEPRLQRCAVVVHNGIELPDESDIRPPSPVANGPLRISCVARIHRKKGHDVLLEALAIATREGRDWHLDCFGDALPEHRVLENALLQRQHDLGLDDRVEWHGFVEGWERFDNADVAVVPSVHPEEFSLVCAEAQSVGLPVVATGPGGASEVLDDGRTGFIVPPRDPQSLVAALSVIDDDRLRAHEMGIAGAQRVRELFPRQRYADAVVRCIAAASTRDPRRAKAGRFEKPRMLVVAPSAELYGSDRSLLNVIPELSQEFAVTIAFAGDGPAIALAQGAGAETIVLRDFAFRRSNFTIRGFIPWLRRRHSGIRTLQRQHENDPFDIVYSNTLAAGLGVTLGRRWHVTSAVHVRECPPDPLWQLRVLLFTVASSSDLVVCNSFYTRGIVTRLVPRLGDRSVVVHNGIPLPVPGPAVGVRQEGPLRISCVGRIHPKKGQDVLVAAAGIAREHGRAWEVHCYGDALPQHESLLATLKEQVHVAGLDDHVYWHGFVEGDERYEDADVAVVPSVYPEEFSLVCVEAQSMGLPVVATGPGGPSEILVEGDTGFIVAPRDPQALYEALARIDDDRDRAQKMGARGLERMHQCFSREVYAQAVRDILRDLWQTGSASDSSGSTHQTPSSPSTERANGEAAASLARTAG